jgi:predicted TIM-barrel fold metal-dependent hydrolase
VDVTTFRRGGAGRTLLDDFIQEGATSGLGASGAIDCHCHAGPGDGFQGPWDSDAPLDLYLRRADAAKITTTVIFAAFHSDYAVANRKVAQIVASDPGRFIGFAFVHGERDRGRVAAMVGEAVTRFGFRGIKCHRMDARITREICEAAARFKIPVLYDVMGEAQSVDLFAPQFPQVKFIIPHLGSFSDDWRAQQALIDVLVRHPNVYTDTSGVRRFDLLVEAVKRAGAGKVLFGSDGPWLHPGLELAKVYALGLPARDQWLITTGNTAKVLGLSGHTRSDPAHRSLAVGV